MDPFAGGRLAGCAEPYKDSAWASDILCRRLGLGAEPLGCEEGQPIVAADILERVVRGNDGAAQANLGGWVRYSRKSTGSRRQDKCRKKLGS